jgi:carbon storage regulator
MLILSRKVNQSIIINGDIVVKVLSVDRNAVRLGIAAPNEVVVNREEIQLAKGAAAEGRGTAALDRGCPPTVDQNGAQRTVNGRESTGDE